MTGILALAKWAITHFAPIFVVTSPVTSYGDQIWSMHKKRSSAGFSLDIPLIMLVASILKIFYWRGARYDTPLLIQAVLMVFVQFLLLHIALLNRPPLGAQHSLSTPFADAKDGGGNGFVTRPYDFWQWRSRKPYWQAIGVYTVALTVLQYLVGDIKAYVELQGYVALAVEAILPLPQILENRRSRSCQGFRLSVLANWLLGDMFKMTYFFLSDDVPLAFKLCGIFQSGCDAFLGVQYWMYGDGRRAVQETDLKEVRSA